MVQILAQVLLPVNVFKLIQPGIGNAGILFSWETLQWRWAVALALERSTRFRRQISTTDGMHVLTAQFTFEILRWVVPDDVYQSPDVELPESLRDSDLHFFMPFCHLLGLAIITNMEDIEALLQIQGLAHTLQVNQEIQEKLLVNDQFPREHRLLLVVKLSF